MKIVGMAAKSQFSQKPEDDPSSTNTSAIKVEGLTKTYGPNNALSDVSFNVDAGKITCLAGPNGSGKTTAVEIIEGLRHPDSGTIELLGKTYSPQDRRPKQLGVQLQEESLPARVKVSEAIRFYSRVYNLARIPADLVRLLGLNEFWWKPYSSLSGGQKRRVVIALAVIADPEVVILDEPTAGLDPKAQETVLQLLDGLKKKGVAVLSTFHDMAQAEKLSDEVLLLCRGQLIKRGAPEQLVKQFGAVNRLALPRSVQLSAADHDHLGTIRTLDVGEMVFLYGEASLLERVGSWNRFESIFQAGKQTLELGSVGLVDVYLGMLDKSEQNRDLVSEVAL